MNDDKAKRMALLRARRAAITVRGVRKRALGTTRLTPIYPPDQRSLYDGMTLILDADVYEKLKPTKWPAATA